jgi:hypothetical protein
MVKCTKKQIRELKTALAGSCLRGNASASKWCCCVRAV